MPTVDTLYVMDTPRALRSLKAGTSVGDVARGTGITHSHISRIFNGRRTPSMACAVKIANFLGITLDDLNAALMEAAAVTPRIRQAA